MLWKQSLGPLLHSNEDIVPRVDSRMRLAVQANVQIRQVVGLDHGHFLRIRTVQHENQARTEPFGNLRVAVGPEPNPTRLVQLGLHPHLGRAPRDPVLRRPSPRLVRRRKNRRVVQQPLHPVDWLVQGPELRRQAVELVGHQLRRRS